MAVSKAKPDSIRYKGKKKKKKKKKASTAPIAFEPFAKQQTFLQACLSRKFNFVLYGGAIRGAKTYAIMGLALILCKLYPNTRGIIMRKDFMRLRRDIFPKFYAIFPRYFIKQTPNAHNGWIAKFSNGSSIVFVNEGYEQTFEYLERFRGFEFDWALLDEISEIHYKTFEKLNERLGTWRMGEWEEEKEAGGRVPPNFIAGTCNPSWSWLKEKVYDKWEAGELREDYLYVPAKVFDNPYITDEWIEKKRETMSPLRFQMFVDGDWHINLNDKLFFYEFDDSRHIVKNLMAYPEKGIKMCRETPLTLSFDFNINPVTCTISQHILGRGLFFFKTIKVNGGTRKILPYLHWTKGYFVNMTGDNSGHSGDSSSLTTDFDILEEFLQVKAEQRTRHQNEKHVYSRNICNEVLYNYPIFFDEEGCKELIKDFNTAIPTKKGGLTKDDDLHRQDAGDTFRYSIHSTFPQGRKSLQSFIMLLNPTAQVLPPKNPKPTPTKSVSEVFGVTNL